MGEVTKHRAIEHKMDISPDISVVIPVYKGEQTLGLTLEALFASQDVRFEVIVVLDGPSSQAKQIATSHPVRIVELSQRSGSAFARNCGSDIAKSDILLFIDADVEVNKSTLSQVLATMKEDSAPNAIFGAYSSTCLYNNFFSKYKNLHHHFIHLTAGQKTETFWTGCGAVRSSVFKSVNGFNTLPFIRNIADIDFGYRLSKAGYEIQINSQIQVRHHKKYSFRSLLKSDLFERAIPWVRIMWSHRKFKSGLNARNSQLLSMLTLFLALFLFFLPLSFDKKFALSFCCLILFSFLNRNWINLCYQKSGLVFALQALVMEACYYLICGIGAGWGTANHFYIRFFKRPIK